VRRNSTNHPLSGHFEKGMFGFPNMLQRRWSGKPNGNI